MSYFARVGEIRPAHAPVDETPPEIERLIQLWRSSCPTNGGEIEINDADLVRIPKIGESGSIYKGKRCYTIYRVPPEIYVCDANAYQPKAVCIGPFFYDQRKDSRLKSMQDYKYVCVDKLISGHDREVLVDKCLWKMKELEGRVRSRYSETFPSIKPDKFAQMLMLDGCFLLYLLLRRAPGEAAVSDDDDDDAWQLVGRLWIWNLVKYDLLLLQNQIPFFVIRHLYDLLRPGDNNINLVDCAINLFSTLDPCRKLEQTRFFIRVEEVHHLLHLIYLSILPCPQYCETYREQQSPQWIPSATELQGAGIKFKKRKKTGGFLSFLDIRFYRRFYGGVIEIPQLKVHDYSVSLFRNLIAFEQCYPDTQQCIAAYAAFMNLLISTKRDMRLLHLNEILINDMTVDKDAANFFGRLCNEVHYAHDRNYLRGLFREVTTYYDSIWHKWRAQLHQNYFSNPWSIISVIAGALLLSLSLIQTIVTGLSR
ncbi:UPF0481 protein At3g47200-like [Phoenix dactylifera]|uniref:UPF0481 protein At3g47200-like n=1 Tax=Phoenix dactylifera TaxID=42345 RepID=A0A8B7BFE3_PHODC|nr:UPF0481 protein At3g47200-like [Phoenix dactylifera]